MGWGHECSFNWWLTPTLQSLTQNTDEGVGQQIAVLVGGITLVNGTGSNLHRAKDDGVPQQRPALV